ncbi:hypothetical protein [Sulfurospirillum barnesii]|uniref:Uncharacterized protein n=1 Tax=Sulfurospirillum barnesii (strain ATCC 700032 / DSM 10660 / SES-3) TaxID=760154 RepID=I3XV22_SULBS|nr:hypothetical protein [Sulfurospirillum barnesii]AFL67796.1 hypothetical protein Sulba_0478 [Sulfurospirillum barnesii SES-3]
MNNLDRSLDKIDIMKLLIFLMIFLIVTFAFIFLLIIPHIKEHRVLQAEHKRVLVHKNRVETLFLEREAQLNKLTMENTHVVLAFKHSFSPEEFIAYAKEFFTQVSLVEVSKLEYQKEFVEYELNVTSTLKTPTNFYNFLEGLNQYKNIVQADFPIHLEANKNTISSVFKIKVYDINATKVP